MKNLLLPNSPFGTFNLINYRTVLMLLWLTLLSGCVIHKGHPKVVPAPITKALAVEVIEDIRYSDITEEGLQGDLYLPLDQGPFPAVLLIHGGSWAGGSRSHMGGIARRLARRGFVVFNVSYRLAPEHLYPAQLDDCRSAIGWMQDNAARYNIRPDKLGVWGFSAGGHLAALLGTKSAEMANEGRSLDIKAVVAGSAPHDLTKYPDSKAVIRFLGTTFDQDSALFREASPVLQVSEATPPMFLYHGTWDRLVDLSHTLDMQVALSAVDVPNELYVVRGLGHIPLFLLGWGSERRAMDFLNYYLK